MAVAERETDGDRAAEQLRFLNVVCIGMIASVFAYAFVAWFLTREDGALAGPGLPGGVAWLGAAVAAALLLAAPIVQRRTRESAAQGQLPEERSIGALEGFRLGTLMAFMLRDGAAIVGLMITIVTGEPMWTYALGAVTIVAMFWGWPRREDLDELLGRQGLARA
jgi:hypothetical protein